MEKHPDFNLKEVFYTNINGEEVLFFHDNEDNTMNMLLNDELYEITERNFKSALDKPLEPWQVIDVFWADSQVFKNN